MINYTFDWDTLAFESKKPLRAIDAIFIAAPRKISKKRFTQIVKEFLPVGNILLGLAKEQYIDGYDSRPHFATLSYDEVKSIIEKVNQSSPKHKIYTLSYSQKDIKYIYEKITFKKVLLVNGSWQYSFHTRPEYYILSGRSVDYQMISPFCDEVEAREYEIEMEPLLDASYILSNDHLRSELEMLNAASHIAKHSYDTAHQTGAVIGAKVGKKYELIDAVWNKVVPHETFALHNGAQREKYFSPPGDLNHYDTIHCEVLLIISAQQRKVDLKGAVLFINLLPCPTCARMLCATDIAAIVYQKDHSDGYAVAMLELAGKTVRRVINPATAI